MLEEPDPGGQDPTANSSNKENSRPVETTTSSANNKGLSRRQRKNRRREDSSPPLVESKKKTRSKRSNGGGSNNTPTTIANGAMPLLKQFAKLGLTELQVGTLLRTSYTLNAEQMLSLGYPVESELHPGRAIIFKSPTTAPSHHYNPYKAPAADSRFDVNAREFVPQQYYVDYSQIKQAWGSGSSGSSDSSSEPASLEDQSDDSSAGQDPTVRCSGAAVRTSDVAAASEERQCVRCGHGFFVASDGEYLTQEHCVYHWGKARRNFAGPGAYSCCGAEIGSPGCSTGKLHVWNGVGVGFNGPFDSYARTRPRRTPPPDGNLGVYALDCEMCYTVGGLELAKVTVVGADGRLVYDCLVRPERDVVDYNTRFSGITARDLSRKSLTKTLREVQNDLMGFINADTVLVGHGLENDLRALRIMHATVVDTAVTFPHYNGLPYRRSLKSLTQCHLKRDIQSGALGHNSCEDARACMELMLWRIRKDFRPFLEQMEQHHYHHHH